MTGVVRDGNFSGQLINGKVKIVIMDEWTSDGKKLLQGSLVVFISLKLDLPALNTFVRDFLLMKH